MKLNLATKNTTYKITEVLSKDPLIVTYFNNLGVLTGTELSMLRKAPWFKDPILFQVEDSQIALTKKEASLIEVEEVTK
jgi:Fe2+ transport system protein FeoA